MEDPVSQSIPYLMSLLLSGISIITPGVIVGLIVIIVLIVCSALISGSEIAYFSFSPGQLDELKNSNIKKDKLIVSQIEKPKRLLATILISNNFVNVAIVIISTYITSELFEPESNVILTFILQVVIVTAIILLFGEILPKVFATQYPVTLAKVMVRPLLFLEKFFYPLVILLVKSTSVIDKRLSKRGQYLSKTDLSEAIEITSDETTPEEEKKILKGIVKFGDIEVKEIMKSRVDVTAIDSSSDFQTLLEVITASGFSRIPVYEDSFDKINGILYVKDLLPHLESKAGFNWLSLIRPAFFVPENKRIIDLLTEFQEKKIHMAIVVDEYGGTSGIVTLEDILEEIVGDISDEFDFESKEAFYHKIDNHNYLFEGKTSLIDFCKIIEEDFELFNEVKGESETLAGLILELLGKIPGKSDIISFEKYQFKIESVDNRRIKKIRVTVKDHHNE